MWVHISLMRYQVMATNFDENSSSSEHQLNSTIQRSSRRTEKDRSKTSKSKESQRMGSRKNFE